MYFTSEVLPKSRYTERELERYYWEEVGRNEYFTYGSWFRAMRESGAIVGHGESYTFDSFFDHLTLVVMRQKLDSFDDEVVYRGPIPKGEVDWEGEWRRYPDPEYGEDGRLRYVGDGEWELVIWTREGSEK